MHHNNLAPPCLVLRSPLSRIRTFMRRPARNSRGSSSCDIQRGSYLQLGGELSQAGEGFGEIAHLQCLVLGLEGRVPLDLGVLRVVMLLHANHVGLLRLANFALPWDGAPPSVPARQDEQN